MSSRLRDEALVASMERSKSAGSAPATTCSRSSMPRWPTSTGAWESWWRCEPSCSPSRPRLTGCRPTTSATAASSSTPTRRCRRPVSRGACGREPRCIGFGADRLLSVRSQWSGYHFCAEEPLDRYPSCVPPRRSASASGRFTMGRGSSPSAPGRLILAVAIGGSSPMSSSRIAERRAGRANGLELVQLPLRSTLRFPLRRLSTCRGDS